MLYLLGILKSPSVQALDEGTREIIHEVVVLSDEYHQNPLAALAIMKCESGLEPEAMHTNNNGTKDIGLWQINDTHLSEAKAEGYNIFEATDNLEYGMRLLAKEGTEPWSASRACWTGQVKATNPLSP